MSTRTFLTVFLGFFVASCAPRYVWQKEGATQQQFASDSYDCERDARQSGYFGTGLIGALNMQDFEERCMAAHGYRKVPVGAATTGATDYVSPGSGPAADAAAACGVLGYGKPPEVYRDCMKRYYGE